MAECAALVAERSRAAWRALVLERPGFYEFFRAATPIDVIERMQIGGRAPPCDADRRRRRGRAGRRPGCSPGRSRATCCPAGTAPARGLRPDASSAASRPLRRSYRGWPFFRSLIDDIEAMLARTDLEIAARYDQLAPTELQHFARRDRGGIPPPARPVLEIKESRTLLDGDRTLQRAIELRNPYVDPMNLMQVDLLRRWRASGREDRDLFEALLASVSGIARGLQTYG